MAKEPQKGGRKSAPPEVSNEDIDSAAQVALRHVDQDSGLIATASQSSIVREEIDIQIATAHQYPRSMAKAIRAVQELVIADPTTAAECIYSLPRAGKAIVGPSIRFAELLFQLWGNNRVAVRVTEVNKREGYVEVIGMYHDLETNSARQSIARRRIKDSKGRVYDDDMIGVTTMAAASIAIRNAILAGIPKPIWRIAYDRAEAVVRGDEASLGKRRATMMEEFKKLGVGSAVVFNLADVGGLQDIGLDEMVVLGGIFTGLKDGTLTVDEVLKARGVTIPAPTLTGAFAPHAAGGPQTGGKADAPKDTGKKPEAPSASPQPAEKVEIILTGGGGGGGAPERPTETASAPPAEDAQASSDSATDASGDTPEETSSPEPQEEPSDDGRPAEQQPSAADIMTADLDEGDAFQEEPGAEEPEEEPLPPWAERMGDLDKVLMTAESWLQVKAALTAFMREISDPEAQATAKRHAFVRTESLIAEKRDPVKETEDPQFYLLWLQDAQEKAIGSDKIIAAYAKLSSSPAFAKLPEAFRAALNNETVKATTP